MDVDTVARALAALLDGVVPESIEAGIPPTHTDVERRALLLLGPEITTVVRSGNAIAG